MRLPSIDFMRGVAITLMLCTHVLLYWLQPVDQWALIIFRLLSNPFVIPNFVFVSGMAFGFSWYQKRRQSIEEDIIRKASLQRTLKLAIISFIYNLISLIVLNRPLHYIWAWYILQSIFFFRILGTFVIGLKKQWRIMIAFLIWFVHFYITEYTNWFVNGTGIKGNKFGEILFYLLYNPLYANGLLIFFPIFCLATIFGENISNLHNKNREINGTEFWWGLSMVILSISYGWMCTSQEIGWNYIDDLQINPQITISCLPSFLIRGSVMWALFSIGCCTILYSIVVGWLYKERSNTNRVLNGIRRGVEFLGRYSLEIYLFQYTFYLLAKAIPYRFPLFLIWIPLVIVHVITFLFAKLVSFRFSHT
ncbi:MAG: heparan-alpha-glucosaminide N-acetyltransferase domain-containing protein [Promethearchaeota archaeon]